MIVVLILLLILLALFGMPLFAVEERPPGRHQNNQYGEQGIKKRRIAHYLFYRFPAFARPFR